MARAGTQSAPITGTGTRTLVAGVAGKRIKVYSYLVVATAAGTVKFLNTGAADLTGTMSFAANGGASAPSGEDPWFSTAVGASLDIATSAATEGHLAYVIEP